MSLISKEHFSMMLKSIKKLLSQKADKSDIVQSDWNQNDETQSDYVKNRTHYDLREETPIIDNVELTLIFAEMGTVRYSYGDPMTFVVGHEYHLILDNEWERFEAFAYPVNEAEIHFREERLNSSDMHIEFSSGEVNTHGAFFDTLSLYEFTGAIERLDEKYIPDTIARMTAVDEINNDIADLSQRAGIVYYGTCSTSTATSEKVVSLQHSSANFELKTGVIVSVKFTYSNNNTMTLNVNSTGAKPIRILNNPSMDLYYWRENSYVTFLYDGQYWNIISMGLGNASTSYYGLVKLSSSVSSTTNVGTAATPRAVKQAYDLANNALPKSGGTMTGDLTLRGDPTSNLHAATKQYVDNAIPEQKQSDWSQTDETAVDFIKNKPSEKSALELIVEMGLVEPAAAEDGSIYTDENGAMYSL